MPHEHFIQSPIGLIPKHNGNQGSGNHGNGNRDQADKLETRLTFHLSHPRATASSVNRYTPKELCSVKYKNLDQAIKLCMHVGRGCFVAKSDMKSAFKNLPIRPEDWCWLIMKAKHLVTMETFYFVEKCVPFGGSISRCHFQRFSDAVEWILFYKSGDRTNNYLDDFLFAKLQGLACNILVKQFLSVYSEINFPVAMEKTEWASQVIVFLGMLLDSINQTVSIPIDKRDKALNLLQDISNSRTVTIIKVQHLAGLLNYLSREIVPACSFTRNFYLMTKGLTKKPHHHINVTHDMRLDCF